MHVREQLAQGAAREQRALAAAATAGKAADVLRGEAEKTRQDLVDQEAAAMNLVVCKVELASQLEGARAQSAAAAAAKEQQLVQLVQLQSELASQKERMAVLQRDAGEMRQQLQRSQAETQSLRRGLQGARTGDWRGGGSG